MVRNLKMNFFLLNNQTCKKFLPFFMLFMGMFGVSPDWAMEGSEKQTEPERTAARAFRINDKDRNNQICMAQKNQETSFFCSFPQEILIQIISFKPKSFSNICVYTEMLLQDDRVPLSLMLSDMKKFEERKGCLFPKSGLSFQFEFTPAIEEMGMIMDHWPHFQRICFAETWVTNKDIEALLMLPFVKPPMLNLTNCFLLTDESKNAFSNKGCIVIDHTTPNHSTAAAHLINIVGPLASEPPHTYIREGHIKMYHIFACAHLMFEGIAAPTEQQIHEAMRQIAFGNVNPTTPQINEGLRQQALGNYAPTLAEIDQALEQGNQ